MAVLSEKIESLTVPAYTNRVHVQSGTVLPELERLEKLNYNDAMEILAFF